MSYIIWLLIQFIDSFLALHGICSINIVVYFYKLRVVKAVHMA